VLGALSPTAYYASHVLVRFGADPGAAAAAALPGAASAQALSLVSGLYDLQLNPGMTVANALTLYSADPRVLSAEPDLYISAAGVPNDPQFSNQWGLQNTGQNGGTVGIDVNAVGAWSATTGSRKIVAAVLDTGFDLNHADLYRNVWINQAEIPASRRANLIDVDGDGIITFADLNDPRNQGAGKITDLNHDGRIDAADILTPMVRDASGRDTGQGGWAFPGNARDGDTAHPNDFFGWNFVANNDNPLDDNGHGTNVAGIIGATGNNGVGVAGLNWATSLMDLKAFDSRGFARIGDVIAAIGYSVAHGAKISNNSWSGASPSQDLLDALNNARNAGQIFVAAAGNDGLNNDQNPDFPSFYSTKLDNVISVAAIDRNGNLASFSNYGAASVTIAAPGVDILSTAPNGGYNAWSGTSQATPFVTGTLALVWAEHPDWNYRQVIEQVLGAAHHLASLAGKVAAGGIVDASAAVRPATQTPALKVDSVRFLGPDASSLNRIVLTFNEAVDPRSFTLNEAQVKDPAGRIIPLFGVFEIANSGGRQWEILFNDQTTPGRYILNIGPDIRDLSGRPLGFYGAVYVVSRTFTYADTNEVYIPDVGSAVSTITVTQDITISDLQLTLNIAHTYDSDLYIHLQGPDGTDVLLAFRVGGSGQNFQNTTFDDEAATSILFAKAPFTGTFQSEAPLSFFNGKNARGVWKLWVQDMAAGDTGKILSWSMVLTNRTPVSGVAGRPAAAQTTAAPVEATGAAPIEVRSEALRPNSIVVAMIPPLPTPPLAFGPSLVAALTAIDADAPRAVAPAPASVHAASVLAVADQAFAVAGSADDARAAFQLTHWVGAGGDDESGPDPLAVADDGWWDGADD
jgi:subtilisin family serine protease/subtilisin-like proprotein convertase family protein